MVMYMERRCWSEDWRTLGSLVCCQIVLSEDMTSQSGDTKYWSSITGFKVLGCYKLRQSLYPERRAGLFHKLTQATKGLPAPKQYHYTSMSTTEKAYNPLESGDVHKAKEEGTSDNRLTPKSQVDIRMI